MSLKAILTLTLIVFYYAMLTYFEEFLTARHPFFKKHLKTGIIQEFGSSRIFYRSRAMREFYTIVKYHDNDKEHTVKISRSLDDCVDGKIILAVGKNNTAVRYGKCNWYNEEDGASCSGKTILALFVFVIIIFHIIIIWANEIKQVYSVFLPFMMIHYLCLPFIIRLRNSLWQLK